MNIVYRHENIAILTSAKNLLELNGIDCLLQNEHSLSATGGLGITNTTAELWVRSTEDTQRALGILEKMESTAASKPPWICGACKEENDSSFEICWNCSSAPSNS